MSHEGIATGRRRAALVAAALVAGSASVAVAQPTDARRHAEEPTAGVNLPTTGISGEHDALSVSANPAGLRFLDGVHLALVLDTAGDEDDAIGPGPGVGIFAAGSLGGGLFPRLGYGLALEFLDPPRAALAPDPGDPIRFTWSQAIGLGRSAALGLAWHHYFDGGDGPLHGLDTLDLGVSTRFGAHLAAGLVLRDLTQPIAAGVPVERRYELEVTARPTANDRLELALGGRAGEIRTDFSTGADLDGWLRGSVRLFRGVYARGQVETRSLFEVVPSPTGMDTVERRELRVTGGLEISLGGVGAAAYTTGSFDGDGDGSWRGGSAVVRLSSREVPSVLGEPSRIERLDLRGQMGERELTRMVAYLKNLEKDDDLVAVLVNIDDLGAGWAATNELRRSLARLRSAGKRVFAYMVAGTTRHYFLASVADKIYVDPAGGLRLSGMVSTTLYFKGLFDKLGVVAQFEKIEEYKSAPEAYTRTGPTEPAFTMRNEIYDSMYQQMVQGIARGRRIDAARVRTLIDNGPYTSGELERIPDLVDAIVAPDDLGEELVRQLGRVYPMSSPPNLREERWDYPSLAVIYIEGDIVDGKSSSIPLLGIDLVGGETIAAAIAAARGNSDVEAIVLRINSPGGSALASEVIAREVFKTRGVKPIICSMGDVAASGGYFAAAGCDVIYADPMTVTGSIGIFNGKFDLSGLLGRLGVSWTFYKRGAMADMDSFLKSYSPDEQRLMKRKLHYYYGRFIKAVASGRGLTTSQVNEVGRGHVWTGAQAIPIRLIDRFGGIGDAIGLAMERAGLDRDDSVSLILLPSQRTGLLGLLLGGLVKAREPDPSAARALLEALLPAGADRALLRAIPGSVWANPGVPQARLPYSIDWGD